MKNKPMIFAAESNKRIFLLDFPSAVCLHNAFIYLFIYLFIPAITGHRVCSVCVCVCVYIYIYIFFIFCVCLYILCNFQS